MCVPGNAEKMHVRAEWLFLENSATLSIWYAVSFVTKLKFSLASTKAIGHRSVICTKNALLSSFEQKINGMPKNGPMRVSTEFSRSETSPICSLRNSDHFCQVSASETDFVA